MLKWLIRNRLAAFERRFGYDLGYARELLDIDLAAFMTLAKLEKLGRYQKDIPLDVLYAVKLVTVVGEDCGPCTQLTVTMALQAGVDADTIAAVLEGVEVRMSPQVLLGVRYARALAARSLEADELREQIEQRWGKRAIASLAFGVAAARIFPTIKYALGHGKACTRVVVAGEPITPIRETAPPAYVQRALS